MPPKKTTKKIVKKSTGAKKRVTKKATNEKPEHFHFLTVLVLFSGFAVYAIMSFFTSTNDFIDSYQASVLDSVGSPDLVAQVPPECQTCPPFPICSPMCGEPEEDESVVPYEIFSDVMSTYRNAVAIEALYDMGIINGYQDGSFKPTNSLNRAELLTILTNAVDADFAGGSYDNCFTDVSTQWFAPFVCYAKESNWVNGFENGSYGPGLTVIKAEALKIVMEAFDYEIPDSIDEAPFNDVALDDWYVGYAHVAKESGVIDDSAFFSAAYELNRAEFVQMVYNAMFFKGLLKG